MKEDNDGTKSFKIHCDNCGRDYEVNAKPSMKELRKWLNRPCGYCNANLLTKRDYDMARVVLSIMWMSHMFGAICAFLHIPTKRTLVRFQGDGSGSLRMSRVDETKEEETPRA